MVEAHTPSPCSRAALSSSSFLRYLSCSSGFASSHRSSTVSATYQHHQQLPKTSSNKAKATYRVIESCQSLSKILELQQSTHSRAHDTHRSRTASQKLSPEEQDWELQERLQEDSEEEGSNRLEESAIVEHVDTESPYCSMEGGGGRAGSEGGRESWSLPKIPSFRNLDRNPFDLPPLPSCPSSYHLYNLVYPSLCPRLLRLDRHVSIAFHQHQILLTSSLRLFSRPLHPLPLSLLSSSSPAAALRPRFLSRLLLSSSPTDPHPEKMTTHLRSLLLTADLDMSTALDILEGSCPMD